MSSSSEKGKAIPGIQMKDSLKNKKVLIVGAAGFFGAHLVRKYLENGSQVTAGCKKSTDRWRLAALGKQIQYVELDVTVQEAVQRGLDAVCPDYVINCAAYGVNFEDQNLDAALNVNVLGAVRLLSESLKRKVAGYFHIGSCSEYGSKDHPVKEDEALAPVHVYGSTKAGGSLLVSQLSREKKFPAVILRPFGMWGEMEGPHRVAPQVVEACLSGKALELTAGEQIRDYTHVSDMAQMTVDLMRTGSFEPGEIINLGSGEAVSLRSHVMKMAGVFQAQSLMLFGKKPYRNQEMKCVVADITKLRKKIQLPMNAETLFSRRVREMAEKKHEKDPKAMLSGAEICGA